jgi:hypothetical protein
MRPKMGFVEEPQPTSLLDFLSISYVITNGTENLSDFNSVFEPNNTLQNETTGDFFHPAGYLLFSNIRTCLHRLCFIYTVSCLANVSNRDQKLISTKTAPGKI